MGATKYAAYSQKAIEIAQMHKALSHPARVQALLMMMEADKGTVSTQELLEEMDISAATLSEHLQVLSRSQIIGKRLITKCNKSYLNYKVNTKLIAFLKEQLINNHRKCEKSQLYDRLYYFGEIQGVNSIYSNFSNYP